MNHARLLLAWALAAPALAQDAIPVALSDHGQGVVKVLRHQPFALSDEALSYDYAKDHPPVRRGTLLVLAVDPDLARPRQVRSPVLYAGPLPVQVVALSPGADCLVGLVPEGIDLAREPLFFGSWELPERVDGARGKAEREAAWRAGLRPTRATALAEASVDATLDASDPAALYEVARNLVGTCPK